MFDSATLSSAIEKKVLRGLLENYTYESFMQELAQWLVNGRYVWYVTGNISSDSAVEIVENVRSIIGLNNLEVSKIGEVLPISMEKGTSLLLEMPLEDKTNENSCSLTYYEIEPIQGDLKQPLVNTVMMQYLNEPFFDDLRTK